MVDEKFIQELFKKGELNGSGNLKETIEFVRDMFEKKLEEQKISESIIRAFTDKIHLAEQFYEIIPFYYDNASVWWVWHTGKRYYEQWDEIDLMNSITFSSPANTINSKERSEILQALKQVGRRNVPKPIKKEWIHFKDFVVDIETGDKFQATPEYFFANPIPHNLGISEETTMMDKLFNDWVGEKWTKTLYEIIAYCLLKDYPLERIFCLLGAGSNGKSCYMKLLREFIGNENVVSTDLDLLIHSRFETSKLRNKMVCIIGETDFNDLNNTSKIKRMTSGKDTIPIEYKNKGGMDYLNYAKLIMATNNLPPTTDKTAGFGRRWCIIDFPNQFHIEKEVLADIPEEEYENLGMKSITLLIELLKKRGFTNEGTIEQRQKRYEEKSNPFDKFWEECIIEDSESHIWKHEFKESINDWLQAHRFRAMSDHTISQYMKKKEIITQKIQADFYTNEGVKPRWNAWMGIKLRQFTQSVKDVNDVKGG